MAKPFAELRELMRKNEITQEELGRRLGRKETYICHRLSGEQPFTLDECYTIMRDFNIPMERMHEVFPPKGRIPADAAKRLKKAQEENEIAALAVRLVRAAIGKTG